MNIAMKKSVGSLSDWIVAGALLVVCYTFREQKAAGREASANIRLISARRADRREAERYQGT
jgi:uncharacterized DUF497 family protein